MKLQKRNLLLTTLIVAGVIVILCLLVNLKPKLKITNSCVVNNVGKCSSNCKCDMCMYGKSKCYSCEGAESYLSREIDTTRTFAKLGYMNA